MFTTPLEVFEFLQGKFENEKDFFLLTSFLTENMPLIVIDKDNEDGQAMSICLAIKSMLRCNLITQDLEEECEKIVQNNRPANVGLFWWEISHEGHKRRAMFLKGLCDKLKNCV